MTDQFESCQMWKIANVQDYIETVKYKNSSSIQCRQKITTATFFCPNCDLFFDTLDQYYIHRANVILRPEVIERSLSQKGDVQGATALGISFMNSENN